VLPQYLDPSGHIKRVQRLREIEPLSGAPEFIKASSFRLRFGFTHAGAL
jgi:hypothetical protein